MFFHWVNIFYLPEKAVPTGEGIGSLPVICDKMEAFDKKAVLSQGSREGATDENIQAVFDLLT
ncbi:hypothetical protein M3212_01980 [Alkalihalobacillus oceani]|uniref:hypothetical protein n=1 Tax=Halalkalibacter oceani TaxID=1653776 RepID=UPI00203FD090|nr:hypothetical protein [Halalkalibacter oceani]MCM3759551.1 hypothetical protein [Halalkalibacter oceani]